MTEYTRVFTMGGHVAHLLPEGASPNSLAAAICGQGPRIPDYWFGTGSQGERERAGNLRLCARCHLRRGQRERAS